MSWQVLGCWPWGSLDEAICTRSDGRRLVWMVVAHRGGIGARMITRFATLSVLMPYALPVCNGLRQRELAFVEANGCVAEISRSPVCIKKALRKPWMIWQRATWYPVSQICGQRASGPVAM